MWRREGNRIYWQYVVGPNQEPGAGGQFAIEFLVTRDGVVSATAWDEDAAGEGTREASRDAGKVGEWAAVYDAVAGLCAFVSNGSAYDLPDEQMIIDAVGAAR